MIYIDFLGPYPRSKKGNTHIIIALDQLTKFVLVKALRKATTDTTLQFLQNQIFCVFGVPQTILSDNGKQFTSVEFGKVMTAYSINHVKTASYSPQANASERVNRSILAAIRSYIDPDQKNWDCHLPSIASALRTTIHSAIGMSPYEALFGQRMVEHGTDYKLLEKLSALNNSEVHLLSKASQMNILHSYIKESLEKAHSDYEKVYNTRSRSIKYTVGEEVFRRNFILSDATKGISAKLSPKFLKMRIRKVIGNQLYELEDMNGKRIGIYHSKDLRR